MKSRSISRLIAVLKSMPSLARSRQARDSELMHGHFEALYPKDTILQEKPRYRGDWFRLETQWMGGELD